MLAEPRCDSKTQDPTPAPERPERAPRKRGGRPKGPPSTILNLRIPLDLLERLDRYLDHLEVQTGLKANRGMIARRAIDLFLETHAPAKRKSKNRRS
jgi:hypothetical protein